MPEDKVRPGDSSDDSDAWLDETRINEDPPAWVDKTNPQPQALKEVLARGVAPSVAVDAATASDEEDEFDRTQVGRAAPVEAREPGPAKPRLICVRGPFSGREFVINDDVAVIGRSSDNVISVADPSVSRRHARLRRDDSGWRVSDLKSDGGTLLNGLPVAADLSVRAGDVLTLGETQIKLLDGWSPNEAPPPDEQTSTMMGAPAPNLPTPSLKRRPARARAAAKRTLAFKAPPIPEPLDFPTGPIAPAHRRGGLPSRTKAKRDAEGRRRQKVIFLWVTLGVALLMIPVFVSATATVMKRRREAELEQLHLRAADVFGHGKDLLRTGDWQDAKLELLRARQMDSSIQVQDFVDRVDREIANQAILERANAALDQNQLGATAELVEKISPDTAQRAPLRLLKRAMLDRARSRVEQARNLVDEGHAAEALQMVTDVLRAFPQDADALRLRDQVATRQSR